jgi:hypothetical protein
MPASEVITFRKPIPMPGREDLLTLIGENGLQSTLQAAEEILQGKLRLFGGKPVPICLRIESALEPWPIYDGKLHGDPPQDIKFTWEPARLGFVFTLGRAYHFTGKEKFAARCWQLVETFLENNPAYMGPNWSSAQEAALRILALSFMLSVLEGSQHTTPERKCELVRSIAEHAARIPPTLIYARAQNNNHLLSEAAGLFTAGVVIPGHPQSAEWRSTGWRLFIRALEEQIAGDGNYVQHSLNYHRLMLQLVLWMNAVLQLSHSDLPGFPVAFPETVLRKIQQAVQWYSKLIVPSGHAPNLGPNDSAYILPLTHYPHEDHRPVLQACRISFFDASAWEDNSLNEMAAWFSPLSGSVGAKKQTPSHSSRGSLPDQSPAQPCVIKPAGDSTTRAYFRAVHFYSRPGHADQLHVDIWWKGINIAMDPGTYLYNGEPPWENCLTTTTVHNTLSVNGLDQMTRAGKFLFLDRAQAKMLSHQKDRASASHDGYRSLGVIHRRTAEFASQNQFIITDQVLSARPSLPPDPNLSFVVSWLVPVAAWKLDEQETGFTLALDTTEGLVQLNLECLPDMGENKSSRTKIQLVSAGKLVHGSGHVQPFWGWVSPNYGTRLPALQIRFLIDGIALPTVHSIWRFAQE